MSYEDAMAKGAREYADSLASLTENGFKASFTQTGGMCAAIEVQLERGHLLVTDPSDELPWYRSEQRGWGVGYYEDEDVSSGPVAYVEDETDCTDERLLQLVRSCLVEAAAEVSATRRS